MLFRGIVNGINVVEMSYQLCTLLVGRNNTLLHKPCYWINFEKTLVKLTNVSFKKKVKNRTTLTL